MDGSEKMNYALGVCEPETSEIAYYKGLGNRKTYNIEEAWSCFENGIKLQYLFSPKQEREIVKRCHDEIRILKKKYGTDG